MVYNRNTPVECNVALLIIQDIKYNVQFPQKSLIEYKRKGKYFFIAGIEMDGRDKKYSFSHGLKHMIDL